MRLFRKSNLSTHQLSNWERDGFLVLRNCFTRREMKEARNFIDDLWRDRVEEQSPLTIDAFLGTNDSRSGRMKFENAPEDARSHVYKLNDAYLEYEFIRDLSLATRVTSALTALIGEEPCICNSLIFERGSQQDLHVDTYYMPPPEGNTLIATSICLEDVHPDAGPIQYVPGSHKLPPYRNADGGRHVRSQFDQVDADLKMHEKLANHPRAPRSFMGKAGDVLIWHEELIHGGTPIVDMQRTRRSLVTHYWGYLCVPQGDREPHGAGWYLQREQQRV